MAGYYIPSIKDGVLSFTPTEEGMPPVAPVNIKGDMGIRGPQGIAGVKGADGTVVFDELTEEQIAILKGDKGDKGEAFTYEDFTEAQLALLKGPRGERGYTGATGPAGADGYTPIKGVDYFDGEPGPKGEDGTMSFEDLTQEQKESLKGDKGDIGPAGPQGERGLRGVKGDTGPAGADGKTPVKGTDYWTAADKTAIVNDTVAAIPLSNYATKTELNKKIALKTATATLSTTGWSGNAQTITVSGITASNTIFATYAPASYEAYIAAQVRCSGQAANSLTFTCSEVPTEALTVNVAIFS